VVTFQRLPALAAKGEANECSPGSVPLKVSYCTVRVKLVLGAVSEPDVPVTVTV
jgi:hypothetical protein